MIEIYNLRLFMILFNIIYLDMSQTLTHDLSLFFNSCKLLSKYPEVVNNLCWKEIEKGNSLYTPITHMEGERNPIVDHLSNS